MNSKPTKASVRHKYARTNVTFPESQKGFDHRFATEDACRRYLYPIRWDSEYCLVTGQPRYDRIPTYNPDCEICGQYEQCRTEHRPASMILGTLLEHTRLPLRMWFQACWLLSRSILTQGINDGLGAASLQTELGLRCYRTAWDMLCRLRAAMRPLADELLYPMAAKSPGPCRTLEMIPLPVTARSLWVRDWPESQSLILLIAMEVLGREREKPGRLRLRVMEQIDDNSTQDFVLANTLLTFPAWTTMEYRPVMTTAEAGFRLLGEKGYDHHVVGVARLRCWDVIDYLSRWIAAATGHSGVQWRYLPYYLSEFCFRFDHQRARQQEKLFNRLLRGLTHHPPLEK